MEASETRATTVAELVRENPLGTIFWWMLACLFGVGILSGREMLNLPVGVAVPLGLVLGTGAWYLLMFAFVKGWIADE